MSTARPEAKEATATEGSQTVTEEAVNSPPTLKLRLKQGDSKTQKKVVWSSETVDNEHLGTYVVVR